MAATPNSYHDGLSAWLESVISQEDHKDCNIQYEMAVNEMEPITLTDQLTRYHRNGFSLNPYAKEFIPLKRTYTFASQITSERPAAFDQYFYGSVDEKLSNFKGDKNSVDLKCDDTSCLFCSSKGDTNEKEMEVSVREAVLSSLVCSLPLPSSVNYGHDDNHTEISANNENVQVPKAKQFTAIESPIHSSLPTIEDINFAFRVLPRRLKESRVLKHLAPMKGEVQPQEPQQYSTVSSLLVDDNCQQLARNPGLDNLIQSFSPATDDTSCSSLTSEQGRFIDELQVPEFNTEQADANNSCDTPDAIAKEASNNWGDSADYGLGMLVSSYVYQTNLHPSMVPDQFHSEIFQTRVIPPLRNPTIPEPIPVVVVARHDEKIQKYLNMDNSCTVWNMNYSKGEWFMTRPDKIMAEKE